MFFGNASKKINTNKDYYEISLNVTILGINVV
jgi:hypothetical protein